MTNKVIEFLNEVALSCTKEGLFEKFMESLIYARFRLNISIRIRIKSHVFIKCFMRSYLCCCMGAQTSRQFYSLGVLLKSLSVNLSKYCFSPKCKYELCKQEASYVVDCFKSADFKVFGAHLCARERADFHKSLKLLKQVFMCHNKASGTTQ